MKHYLSFLVLSLFVFLSLVCPSSVMASTALDFTWNTVDSEYPSDGSFSFSGKVNDAIKSWGDSWVGFNSSTTATSRSTYSLSAGTYVFTLRVQWRNENRTNTQVPKIVINNGSDYEFTHPNVDLSNGVAVDLRYFVTVPSTGSYTIKVVSVDGERDKFGVRSLTMPSSTISCVYTVNNLIMKVITINKVSTFELSHASSSITSVNNVNPANLNGGVTIGGTPTSDFNTSNWKIKDGKARKDIEWTTLPTNNQLTQVFFYAWIGSEIGGSFENFDISCDPSDGPSCTAPNHVDISGDWDYFGGEDISLTATAYSSAGTGSPIADANITGWQWQKWYNDRWNNVTDGTDGDATISGATTKNLQIANCSKNNSGSYQCVVSTGASCSTASGSEVVKVFTLEGYTGGTTVYNFTRVGDTQSGTLELELNANTDYEFKFHVDTKFYGHNGHITADATNVVCYEKYNNADAPNITIKTGVEGGTFIIGMEYSTGGNNSNEGEPEISVTYPRKKIYFNPGGSTYWDQGGAQFALYYQRNSGENNGWTDIMSPFTCDGDVYSADIPLWHGVSINCVRLNNSATNNNKADWWNNNKWNQTADITISASYNKYTITGWEGYGGTDCPYSSSTYSPTTYTISFAGNGSDGGTNMTNVSSIACDGEVTLVANTWTKTGHSFSGWKTNVAVTANGSPVAANDIVADEATISNITSNITLTAQWTPNPHTLTWVLDGGTVTTAGTQAPVNATGSPSGTVNYGETVTAPTVTKTGYNFSAWSPAVVSPMPDADKTYMATWTVKTTAITIDANTSYHGSTGSSVTATWGQALPVFTAASGASGWSLEGYYTGANDGTKIINADGTLVAGTTYTTADSKWNSELTGLTLYPHYAEAVTYAVTVNKNEDYGTVTGAGSYASGATVNITATPAGGYEFVNWETSDGVTFADANSASTSFTMIGSTVTVTANFRAETCESGYTLEVEDDFVLVTPGDGARTTPQGDGWYNTGWYTSFHGNGFFDMRGSEGEIYLPVHLNGGTYSFTIYNLNGNNKRLRLYSKTSSNYTTITYGGSTYYRMSSDGYTVTGKDDDAYQGTAFVSCLIENVALSAGDYIIGLKSDGWASWDQVVITNTSTYNVTYATGDSHGTSISAANTSTSANIEYGSSVAACTNVTFTAGVATGYEVDYWTVNDVPYHAADGEATFSIDVNRNIAVVFYTKEASNYAVTVNTNNGSYGSASADAATYASGATVTLTATPNEGYRFVNWTTSNPISITDATSASTTFTMIASAVTVQANFAEATCMSTKTIEAESYIPDWFAYRSGEGISKPTDGEFSGTSYVQFNQETEINYFVSLPAANYRFHIYHSGTGNNKYFNLYGLDDSAGSDYVTYNGHKYKNTTYKGTALNEGGSRWTDQVVACNLPANDYIIGLYGNDGSNIIYDKIVIEAYGNVNNDVFCYHSITMNTTAGTDGEATSGVGRALLGDIVTISAPAASSGYHFTGWTASPSVTFTSDPSVASNSFTMPNEDVTLTANYALDEYTISELPWAGSQDLTGQSVVSAEAINSCFDSEITFTFTGTGTVNYYDNTDRELGTAVTSGTAITLTDDLREHGIYIKCTSGTANLTEVSKTTVGSVYTIWSGSVNVSADYTGVNEAGDKVTLRAEDQDWWLQQVVLGPEHFQTAAVGDTLRVTYTNIDDYAMGAIQTATKYNAIPGNIYKESDGSQVTTNTHDFDLPSSGYYHIITAGSLDSLKNKGIVVKGKGHTITRVSLHASCSNLSLRTTAPDKTTYGDDESINIMTGTLKFGDGGFNLGNWEHQVELDKSCFTNVTVGSIINLYMSVVGDATLSFRCNVPSIIADDKRGGVGCPSYGDISFDRTIDDLYGNTPSVVGETGGYKVMYLKVDADMERRLKETGMILCGKGTLIKVVEGVEDTVTVMPNENKPVPTVVNNIVIYQGGQVTNEEDIMVLGSITYIRHAKGGALSNKLDQWYTFALPFTVSDVEVLDTDGEWYDINAVYYLSDATNQATYDPDGAGHYYLQYLKAENETAIGRDFAARWQYITPGHSERIYAYGEDRYGYPKKDSAYIILFDSDQPRELPSGYWDSNPTIRFVGVGPQTIDGVAKKWQVEADGEQYWMYANNTLHSFTLTDAYLLNDAGTEFVLQESPTIRPFECYVQATESLKAKYAAIPMRGFRIDNTTTGAESIQGSAIRAEKILRNGQLIIIRNGVEYDATGVVIR